jgi:anti-anti-sigma regulatory factor
MSVELYSEDIIVVSVGGGPSTFKIWLRTEAPGDLTGDLQWLCEECPDYHVIVDFAGVESFGSTTYKRLLDLRELTEDYDYRFILCGLSEHLKWQLKCVHLADEFAMFDTRKAAITELSAGCEVFL